MNINIIIIIFVSDTLLQHSTCILHEHVHIMYVMYVYKYNPCLYFNKENAQRIEYYLYSCQ